MTQRLRFGFRAAATPRFLRQRRSPDPRKTLPDISARALAGTCGRSVPLTNSARNPAVNRAPALPEPIAIPRAMKAYVKVLCVKRSAQSKLWIEHKLH